VYLYDISVETAKFEIMKESVAGITATGGCKCCWWPICFGAFMERSGGLRRTGGKLAGAFMIGLGFKPFHGRCTKSDRNTAPVAWGAIGTPVHALAAITASADPISTP